MIPLDSCLMDTALTVEDTRYFYEQQLGMVLAMGCQRPVCMGA